MNLRQFKEPEQELSNREKELIILAFRWYKNYIDSNPEVGMGPFDATLIKDIFEKISFKISKKDQDSLIEAVKQLRTMR